MAGCLKLSTTPVLCRGGDVNSPRCILPNQIRGVGQANFMSIFVQRSILERIVYHVHGHTMKGRDFLPHLQQNTVLFSSFGLTDCALVAHDLLVCCRTY